MEYKAKLKKSKRLGQCAIAFFDPIKMKTDDEMRMTIKKLDEESNLKEKEDQQDDELLDFEEKVIK